MEQLGNLLTAMIAIIVGGQSALLAEAAPIRSELAELAGIDLKEFRQRGRYYGVFALVAKQLHVTSGYVARTVRLEKCPRPIVEALLKEMRRIDRRKPAAASPPLTSRELCQFKNGKYRGIFTRVGASMQMRPGDIWAVGRGKRRSERVLAAIRAEMARVDAGSASKKKEAV
jgi:hypothetical protein